MQVQNPNPLSANPFHCVDITAEKTPFKSSFSITTPRGRVLEDAGGEEERGGPITSTGANLPFSRLGGVIDGKLEIGLTDGNLPASRSESIDMIKVGTGNLSYNRIQDFHLGVNERFTRVVCSYEKIVNTSGVWTNKFQINTNLHLNYYNLTVTYHIIFTSFVYPYHLMISLIDTNIGLVLLR